MDDSKQNIKRNLGSGDYLLDPIQARKLVNAEEVVPPSVPVENITQDTTNSNNSSNNNGSVINKPSGNGSDSNTSWVQEANGKTYNKTVGEDVYTGKEYEANLGNVNYVTKNKTMSYSGRQVQDITDADEKVIVNKLNGNAESRYIETPPPGYHDGIVFPHREHIYKFSNEMKVISTTSDGTKIYGDADRYMRIGDCMFVIPPEFITVTTVSSHDSIQGIRHSGSSHIKNGYSSKEIQISLVLNGMDQINGYACESPFEGSAYYMDGLRSLISQFKYTPFLPIENTVVNLVHGVYAVALRNIAVETIPGFPETLQVTLSMQEFDIGSYIDTPPVFFSEAIDWDLFRYFVQRPMQKNHPAHLNKITTPRLTNGFSFKILSKNALEESKQTMKEEEANRKNNTYNNAINTDDLYIDIHDDKNYTEMVSDKDNLSLTHLSFSMGNIMPVIQLAGQAGPTMQYLGATDTTFSFGFETTDQSVAALFNKLNDANQQIVRENRYINGIGFMKIENELVQLTGTNFVLMTNVNVSTVPGFPGMFTISIECVSYDAHQSDKEKLIGMRPFPNNRKGTRKDLINQDSGNGVLNKIAQECNIQHNLQEVELYPDLHLPTYAEIDSAISFIRKYRAKHNLTQMSITHYPRHTCILPGSKKPVVYEKYVDPDFYVFTLISTNDKERTQTPAELADVLKTGNKELRDAVYNNTSIDISKKVNKVLDLLNCGAESPLDLFVRPKLIPDPAIEPDFAYGYEPNIRNRIHKGHIDEVEETGSAGTTSGTPSAGAHEPGYEGGTAYQGGTGDPSTDPTTVTRKSGNPFVDLLCNRADAKCGYTWGASGQILTSSNLSSFKKTHGSSHYTGDNDVSHWIGKQVFDCSGFVSWGLRKVGLKPAGWRTSARSFGALGVAVSKSDMKPGDVFYSGSHVGVYIGNDMTVEAANSRKGVIYGRWSTKASKYSVVRIRGLAEANDRFLAANPNFYTKADVNSISTESEDSRTSSKTKSARTPDANNGESHVNVNTANSADNKVVLANFGPGEFSACDKWNTQILNASKKYKCDPNMIKVIISIESTGDPNLVNKRIPEVKGLMQVYTRYHKLNNPFDPQENIYKGTSVFCGYAQKWNWGLNESIVSYHSGPGNARKTFINKTRSMSALDKEYVRRYKKRYGMLVKNGANPGNLYTIKEGGFSGNPTDAIYESQDGEVTYSDEGYESQQEQQTVTWDYTDEDFKNPNAGKVHGDKVAGVDTDDFGKDYIEVVAKSAFHPRSQKMNFLAAVTTGALAFANPLIGATGLIAYSVLAGPEIKYGRQVFNAKEIAKKLQAENKSDKAVEYMFVDSVKYNMKGLLTRAFPSYLLVFIDEQGDWVDRKKLWSNYYVCRSAIDISIHEAYDNPVHTAHMQLSNVHNNLTHLMNVRTTSELAFDNDGLQKKIYQYTGAIIDEKITDKMIEYKNELYSEVKLDEGTRVHIRLGYGSNPARYPTSFNGTITQVVEGEVVEITAQSDGVELLNSPLSDKTNDTNKDVGLGTEVSNIITELLISRESDFLYGFSNGFFKIKNKYGIEHFGIHFNDSGLLSANQYDLVKNIYNGTYEGVPFSRNPLNPFDGEFNYRFGVAGKTPWDAMKMCEKAVPEFIAYPRYFGFESRMFFGLPDWLCKYMYNDDDSDIVEHAKAFAQVHTVTSYDSIIDNNLKLDTRNLATNMVGVYTLGGDLATTPVIMSDRTIDWSRQVTRTIDTTSVQDASWVPGFVDKLLSWTGMYDNGKSLAINVCISELMISWKETYKGSILMLGQPEISAYDYIFLSDDFLYMKGMLMTREVVHSINVSTGFTTSVVPGMIVHNTLKKSGLINVLKSVGGIAASAVASIVVRYAAKATCMSVASAITSSKLATFLAKTTPKVTSFIAGKGKSIWAFIKSGKNITKLSKFYGLVGKAATAVKGAKLTSMAASAGSWVVGAIGAITPVGWAAIAIGVAITATIAIVWNSIADMFDYRQCIVVNPIMVRKPDDTVRPLLGNCRGARDLLLATNKEMNEEE